MATYNKACTVVLSAMWRAATLAASMMLMYSCCCWESFIAFMDWRMHIISQWSVFWRHLQRTTLDSIPLVTLEVKCLSQEKPYKLQTQNLLYRTGISPNFCDDLMFAISFKLQIIQYAEIISCIVICKKHFKSQKNYWCKLLMLQIFPFLQLHIHLYDYHTWWSLNTIHSSIQQCCDGN